jgi:hypothetical protein
MGTLNSAVAFVTSASSGSVGYCENAGSRGVRLRCTRRSQATACLEKSAANTPYSSYRPICGTNGL